MDGLKGLAVGKGAFLFPIALLGLPSGLYGHVLGWGRFGLRPGDRLLGFGSVQAPRLLPCCKYPGVNARSAEGQSPYFMKNSCAV